MLLLLLLLLLVLLTGAGSFFFVVLIWLPAISAEVEGASDTLIYLEKKRGG